MVVPVESAGRRARLWCHRLAYPLIGLVAACSSLLLLELLLGRRLAQQQLVELGSQVASNLVLGEVALERFSPEALSDLTGLRLAVGSPPEGQVLATSARPAERRLRRQAERLRGELCRRLPRCPAVWPTVTAPRGVWVEMGSPLETVWLFAPLPSPQGWPPDPLLLTLALAAGGLSAGLLFQALEVQRPLDQLEEALAGVGLQARSAAVPARGSGAVRRLTSRFNAMVERLERSGRERTTMLAGIAHDLRAPLTRLRLRLSLAATAPMGETDLARAEADIAALERITRQFLLFAGAEQAEAPLALPLDALVAEAAAVAGEGPLQLELEPLVRVVRPTALSRAVANLIENALAHGAGPLRLVLRAEDGAAVGAEDGAGFEIQVWDQGPGIPQEQWARALTPFQRLDQARGGQGHCGLGLAIAERVARDHGGGLERRQTPQGFAVILRGRSLVTSGHTSPPAESPSGRIRSPQ